MALPTAGSGADQDQFWPMPKFYFSVDSDDLIFKQYDGTTVLTLDDDTTVKVATDLTVGDDVGLISDSAELTFGANSEVKVIHQHDSGLAIKHTATADDKPVSLILQTCLLYTSDAADE